MSDNTIGGQGRPQKGVSRMRSKVFFVVIILSISLMVLPMTAFAQEEDNTSMEASTEISWGESFSILTQVCAMACSVADQGLANVALANTAADFQVPDTTATADDFAIPTTTADRNADFAVPNTGN